MTAWNSQKNIILIRYGFGAFRIEKTEWKYGCFRSYSSEKTKVRRSHA